MKPVSKMSRAELCKELIADYGMTQRRCDLMNVGELRVWLSTRRGTQLRRCETLNPQPIPLGRSRPAQRSATTSFWRLTE